MLVVFCWLLRPDDGWQELLARLSAWRRRVGPTRHQGRDLRSLLLALTHYLKTGFPLVSALDYALRDQPPAVARHWQRVAAHYRAHGSWSKALATLGEGWHRDPGLARLRLLLVTSQANGSDLSRPLMALYQQLQAREMRQARLASRLAGTRVAAALLAGLPWLMGGFYFYLDRGALRLLLFTRMGLIALLVGLGCWLLGLVVQWRLTRLRVSGL